MLWHYRPLLSRLRLNDWNREALTELIMLTAYYQAQHR